MTPFVARRSGTSQTPGENEKGSATSAPASLAPRTKSKFEPIPGEPMFDLIELLFFAYRDFVGDADRLLEKYDFGRAHHRVLHFVNRNPGLTIAELLDILRITKQSLNRVLKELVEQGYVEARAGTSDRRQLDGRAHARLSGHARQEQRRGPGQEALPRREALRRFPRGSYLERRQLGLGPGALAP